MFVSLVIMSVVLSPWVVMVSAGGDNTAAAAVVEGKMVICAVSWSARMVVASMGIRSGGDDSWVGCIIIVILVVVRCDVLVRVDRDTGGGEHNNDTSSSSSTSSPASVSVVSFRGVKCCCGLFEDRNRFISMESIEYGVVVVVVE